MGFTMHMTQRDETEWNLSDGLDRSGQPHRADSLYKYLF